MMAGLATLFLLLPMPASALDEMSDDSMANVTGQALLVADKIAPNSLPCA